MAEIERLKMTVGGNNNQSIDHTNLANLGDISGLGKEDSNGGQLDADLKGDEDHLHLGNNV